MLCVFIESLIYMAGACVHVEWSGFCVYVYVECGGFVCVCARACVVYGVCTCVFSKNSEKHHEGCIPDSAFNGEDFLEAAGGMKCAAVKLEEYLGENQIGSEANEGASS